MITNDTEFYKALADIRVYLRNKAKDNDTRIDITCTCQKLYLLNDKA